MKVILKCHHLIYNKIIDTDIDVFTCEKWVNS